MPPSAAGLAYRLAQRRRLAPEPYTDRPRYEAGRVGAEEAYGSAGDSRHLRMVQHGLGVIRPVPHIYRK